jgi:CRP-like cAMP-binding protein
MGQELVAPRLSTEQNQILARLPERDLARLVPHLQPFELVVREFLEKPDEPIKDVYFVLDGIVSLVAGTTRNIEIGIVGRDGMTGTSVVLGARSSPHQCFVQVAGKALRIKSSELVKAMEERPSIQAGFLRYVRELLLQTAQTALANGIATTEQRLARWLVMSQDRLQRDEIALTHEFLSLMIGVWRPKVTIALQSLEEKRLIKNTRGLIHIVGREGLEEVAGDCYRPSRSSTEPLPS